MRRHPLTSFLSISSFGTIGVLTLATSGEAAAATPTYYDSLVEFQADIPDSITDDYSNPAYVFIQSDDVMSSVFNETDYHTTGFMNLNIVSGGTYCAGCNGSFELSFQTTSIGNPTGINAVGLQIISNDFMIPYFAFITFADGTTENVALPSGGSWWGVEAPERIERIHFGLSDGGTTMSGSFQIDDLVIGEGTPESCPGASFDVSTLTQGTGNTVSRTGTTTGAFDDIDEPAAVACWESTGDAEHVYRMVLDTATWLQIDTEDSVYDTKLAIVEGCPGGETFCAFNDDYGGTVSGFDCANYQPGTYSLIVGGATGNTGAYTLSLTECSPCGNNVIDPGEACDDGNNLNDDGCVDACVVAACGDGHVFVGMETCDDGNVDDTDDCLNSCVAASCGDGVIQAGVEGCDDQDADNTDACIGTCQIASCGDGFIFAGFETCDDANAIDGDGCTGCQLDSAESSSGGAEESSSGGGETSSTGAAESSSSGGGESTGAGETTGGGGESTSGGGSASAGVDTSGGGGETTGGGGGESSSSGTGEASGDSSGCGCTSDGAGAKPWFMVVLAAAMRRRRR